MPAHAGACAQESCAHALCVEALDPLDACEALWACMLRAHPVEDHRGEHVSPAGAWAWCSHQQLSVGITPEGVHFGGCSRGVGIAGSWTGWGVVTSSQSCACWSKVLRGLHRAGSAQPHLLQAAYAVGVARGSSAPDRHGSLALAVCELEEWCAGGDRGEIAVSEIREIAEGLRCSLEAALGFERASASGSRVLLTQLPARGASAGAVSVACTESAGGRGVLRRGAAELVELLRQQAGAERWGLQVAADQELSAGELAVVETLVTEGTSLEAALELGRGATALCP